MATKKVFLSYTRRDLNYKVVTLLRERLEALPDVDLWVDTARLPQGLPAEAEINSAIRSADVFVPVLSDSYSSSEWGLYESSYALRRQLQDQVLLVAPVRVDRSETPRIFEGFPIIDLSQDFEAGFRELSDLIAAFPDDRLGLFELADTIVPARPILEVSNAVSERLISHLAAHPDELRVFDRRLFEELVAELFSGFGYEVELTKRTRDGGRDVIAIRHREVAVKYLIECKRPDPGRKVGVRPVRELYGVKTDEHATKAILATTAEFTRDAHVFFDRHRWELEPRDHAGLLAWLREYLGLRIPRSDV